jgi:acetyltransferase-like isoleucine patch superfamily enzyme
VRKILRPLFENKIVFAVVRAILSLNGAISAFISHLKLRALVKEVGRKTSCHWTVEIKHGHNICIGEQVTIGRYSSLGALSKITIGSHVRIARGAMIETGGLDFDQPPPYPHISKEIRIEDGVWIGMNAVILGGVTIGARSVVGAGVIVNKDVKPNSIVVGQPPRRATLHE